MTNRLIDQVRNETTKSAFLTPWGIRECAKMTLTEICLTFGEFAADFWDHVRRGSLVIPKQGAR